MQVDVAEAKNKLPELIRAVEDGQPVTICRRGVPVADLLIWAVDSRDLTSAAR
jgi:prevent-host-death family protein